MTSVNALLSCSAIRCGSYLTIYGSPAPVLRLDEVQVSCNCADYTISQVTVFKEVRYASVIAFNYFDNSGYTRSDT